jgi:hypothetical protein
MSPIGKLNRHRTPSDWEDSSDDGSKAVIVSDRPSGSGSGAGYVPKTERCFLSPD